MALIKCKECEKEISDQAVACPSCGAPVRNALNQDAKVKSVSNKRWVVLALILGSLLFVLSSIRQQSLPLLPIEVGYRNALLGPGMVLQVKNTSDQILTVLVTLNNPTTSQEQSFRLDIDPHGVSEIGHKEGWILAQGDNCEIKNNQFKPWIGSIQ